VFKRFALILCLLLSFSVFGSAGQYFYFFPLVIEGTLANGYSWKTSFQSLGCSMAFTSVQDSPLVLAYARASCSGNSFAREEVSLHGPDGNLLASAQLTQSVSGTIWSYRANPGDVIVIFNDNDIAVNVAVGSNVVTIPPHSGLYDVLDNVVHGAYRSLIAIESYQQAEIYVLGLRYTRAGFEIIQPEHSNEETVTSSASSNNGGNGSNGNSEQCPGNSCRASVESGKRADLGGGRLVQKNGPGSNNGGNGSNGNSEQCPGNSDSTTGEKGKTPGHGGGNPSQGNGPGSNNGGNGSNGNSGQCPGNSCNAPGQTGNTPGQGGGNPGQGNGPGSNNGGNGSNGNSGQCPGNSCNAPGQTGDTPGQGGGNPGQGNGPGRNDV